MKLGDGEAIRHARADVCGEAFYVPHAIGPRRAHRRETLDDSGYLRIACLIRDHLLREIIERDGKAPKILRDAVDHASDRGRVKIHRVALPNKMRRKREIEAVAVEKAGEIVRDVIAGDKSDARLDSILLKPSLFESERGAVVDLEIGDALHSLSLRSCIQSGAEEHDLAKTAPQLRVEPVVEIARSQPYIGFHWREGCENAIRRPL